MSKILSTHKDKILEIFTKLPKDIPLVAIQIKMIPLCTSIGYFVSDCVASIGFPFEIQKNPEFMFVTLSPCRVYHSKRSNSNEEQDLLLVGKDTYECIQGSVPEKHKESVYFASLFCFPLNETKKDQEGQMEKQELMALYLPFLLKQIEIIKPKRVIFYNKELGDFFIDKTIKPIVDYEIEKVRFHAKLKLPNVDNTIDVFKITHPYPYLKDAKNQYEKNKAILQYQNKIAETILKFSTQKYSEKKQINNEKEKKQKEALRKKNNEKAKVIRDKKKLEDSKKKALDCKPITQFFIKKTKIEID